MNIVNLKTFLAVVQVGNLNKAAERLHVTQSTVTARLDALDDTLGHALLLRSRKGAQLTKAGFAFQRHAELIVRTWDQGRMAVGLPDGYSGMISVACHTELWDGHGERWAAAMHATHRDVALELWPGEGAEINRWLDTGLVDAAFSLAPVSHSNVVSVETTRERLVQVSSELRTSKEWDERYIFVDLGADFRRDHSMMWPSKNTARMTFGSSRWALEHLLCEGGSAYLPWRMTRELCEAERLFLVDGSPEFSRPVYFSWRELSAQAHPWLATDFREIFKE